MNSLLGYGSDDDFDDSSDEKQTDWRTTPAKKTFDNSEDGGNRQLKQSDANYDEVQMDLSEESNDSCPKTREKSSSDQHHHHHHRNNHRDHRSSNSRHRSRSSDRDRNRRLDDNRSNRDRYDKYRNSTGNSRDSRDKRSRRSLSKDRRNRNNSRSPPSRKSSRSRSRSRSKSRSNDINRKSVNNDRTTNDLIQKQPIQSSQQKPAFITTVPTITPLIQTTTTTTTRITRPTLPIIQQTTSQTNNRGDDDRRDDRFFMPGITGRFREQIERRKLLWQKKDTTTNNPTKINTGVTKKVWETTTFAQDTDGKVANKFKRLMGIKNTTDDRNGSTVDVLKKQEEMFSSMEQQYEVARTATHTMRGVGLGFSSNYPR